MKKNKVIALRKSATGKSLRNAAIRKSRIKGKLMPVKGTKKQKIKKIMKEWKAGELNIGKSNKKVKNKNQAIAIALSVARKQQRTAKKKKK